MLFAGWSNGALHWLLPSGATAGYGELDPRQWRGSRWWLVQAKYLLLPALMSCLESVLALTAGRSLFAVGTAEAWQKHGLANGT